MARYVELDGVRTWYAESGQGEPVVLLHGGLTDGRAFTGNLAALADRFRVLMPDRRGHGRTPDVPGPITVEVMARDTIAFLEHVVRGPARLVGYSAGALVALRAAVRRPDLVDRLVLVSGAYDVEGLIVRPTADGDPPAPLAAAYAEVSPDGPDHFRVVIGKIAEGVRTEPGLTPAELSVVRCPALVVAADDDIVTLDHTVSLYRALPDAQLAVLPGTSHLLLYEKPRECVRMIGDFLTGHPAPTMMPLRRHVG